MGDKEEVAETKSNRERGHHDGRERLQSSGRSRPPDHDV